MPCHIRLWLVPSMPILAWRWCRTNAAAPPVSDTNSGRDHAIPIRQLNRRFVSRCYFQELSQAIFHSAYNHEHSQWLDDLLSAATCTYPAGTLN